MEQLAANSCRSLAGHIWQLPVAANLVVYDFPRSGLRRDFTLCLHRQPAETSILFLS